MKITIEVYKGDVKQIKEEYEYYHKKKIGLKEVAKRFAQDIIDRYYSVEYLDNGRIAE